MFKKILCIWNSYRDWEMSRDICYYYPMNQVEYQEDPIKERTMELSEFQDGMEDIGTRDTEWEVFEERVADRTGKSIYGKDGLGDAGSDPDRFMGPNSH